MIANSRESMATVEGRLAEVSGRRQPTESRQAMLGRVLQKGTCLEEQ
jgi:hypothetical protein